MTKLSISILHKNSFKIFFFLKINITQTNFLITSWFSLQSLLIEFYQVYEKSYLQYGSQFFFYLIKPNIFVQRIYQLANFDMNFKDCHIGCLRL